MIKELRWPRIRLGAAVTVAAAGLGLMLAGCGTPAEDPAVPTALTGAPTATAPPSTNAVTTYVTAMRSWVDCMRKGGVDLPDPDAKGNVDVGDLGKRKSDPKFLTASQSCRRRQPARPAELQPVRPPLTAEQIANARAYAACMRANGVPTFRDPGPDGYPAEARPTGPDQAGGAVDASFRAGQLCEPVLNGRPPATSFDPAQKGQG